MKEEKPEICDICGKAKPKQMSEQVITEKTQKACEDFTKMDTIDIDKKPELCDVCGKLKVEQRLYVCAECKTTFTSEEELKGHLKMHNYRDVVPEISNSIPCPVKMEPDLCNVCGKRKHGQVIPENELFAASTETTDEESSGKNDLEFELKEEKPELCEVCGKAKPKQKLLVCAECKTVFNAEGELDEHLRMHSCRSAVTGNLNNEECCGVETDEANTSKKDGRMESVKILKNKGETECVQLL